MAVLPVLTSFELQLSDEIVKDLSISGKTFRKELNDGHAAAGRPVDMAGDRLSLFRQEGAMPSSLQMCSIQLEKSSETVIKLFITVFKPDSREEIQQTDTPAKLSDLSVQTESPRVHNIRSQTDRKAFDSSSVQTDEMRLRQTFREMSSETDCNLSTQVDGVALAVDDLTSSSTQTEIKTACCKVQTDRNEANVGIQTDRNEGTTGVQTDSSMAWLVDGQTQVLLETSDKTMQTELAVRESLSQTDMSIARQCEREVQASVEVKSEPVQTEVNVGEDSSQTDMSMSSQVESECQCSVDAADLSCQTEQHVEEAFSQTTISMSLQAEQETQMSADLTHSLSQTDISQYLQADVEIQTLEEPEPVVQTIEPDFNSSQESGAELNLSQENNASALSQEGIFTEIVNRLETDEPSPKIRRLTGMTKDGVAQTDPVTIIIGDASFLVKKLKSSAISPSKVTTSGNEIEIELSAEVAGLEAPFEAEEKENDVQCYPAVTTPQAEVVMPRTGPMYRGGTPGMVTRTGTGGGVRVRLPVSMQSPLVVQPVQPRMHPGPSVRFQTPPVIRSQAPTTPVSAPKQATRAAGASSGGTFSCPFCSLIFIDSPALYEHLSINHQLDQKTKWKQPKGREGKTIIPRKPRSPERGPPVLTPIEPLGIQQQAAHFLASRRAEEEQADLEEQEEEEDDEEVAQEAGLFEDPVETPVTKKRKGRPAKTKSSDLDQSISDDDAPLAGKRKRKEKDSSTKKARTESQWKELEDEEEAKDNTPVRAVAQRGGRAQRSTRTK